MSDRTQSSNYQQQARTDDMRTVVATIDHQREKYVGILPSDMNWDDFRNAFLIAVQINPRLLDADRNSLWLALQRAAGDGLKPDGREGALVIFGDDDEDGNPSQAKGKKKVVWMPMVWGLCKLVRNTGIVKTIRAQLVYKGETFVISDANGQRSYTHTRDFGADEIDDSTANIIAAYSIIEYKNGDWDIEPMSRRRIDRVKAISRAKKGPWGPWYDEQAKKTVLRSHIKRLDRSRELRRMDEAIDRDATLEIDGTQVEREAQAKQIVQEFTAPASVQRPEKEMAEMRQKAAANQHTNEQNIGQQGVNERMQQQWSANSKMNLPGTEIDIGRANPVDIGTSVSGSVEKHENQQPADPIEIWPTDEIGEPVGNEPMTPMLFAQWFEVTLFKCGNPNALREHNADAMGEAGADPVAARIISDAIARHVARQEVDAKATAEKQAGPPKAEPASGRKPIVALTPKGAIHVPNYHNAAKAEIATLKDEADIQDWMTVNKPTYKNRAIEIAIDNWIRDRRRELGLEGDTPPADAPMTAEKLKARVLDEIAGIRSLTGLKAWSEGAIRPFIMGLKTINPTIYQEIIKAIDTLENELQAAEMPT